MLVYYTLKLIVSQYKSNKYKNPPGLFNTFPLNYKDSLLHFYKI